MRHHIDHRGMRLLVAVTCALGALGTSSTASAGGWAVGSLDEVPSATTGESEQIGFTILQHGETPVDLTEDVGIEIVHADGTIEYFPAAGDGTVGHYLATVVFPDEAGSYTWSIRMGWFSPQELGTLDVAAPSGGGSGGTAWDVARWFMPVIAVALAAVAVADFVMTRRRRRAVPA